MSDCEGRECKIEKGRYEKAGEGVNIMRVGVLMRRGSVLSHASALVLRKYGLL